MAKKAKSAKKRVSTPRRSNVHHWHPNEFLLVVAGGFVVIILVFLLSGAFKGN